MMQPVMRAVITNVAEDPPTEDSDRNIPVIPEDEMGKLIEGGGEDEEKWRGHDQAVSIHGQIVVNAMQDEM